LHEIFDSPDKDMNMNIIALMMEAIRIREKPVCFG
jgi:hypothetical protein